MKLRQLIIIATLAIPVSSFAEILTIGSHAKVLTRSNSPTPGMTKDDVIRKYGKPTRQRNSQGKATKRNPKISLWDYKKSTVYFENNHVIHTVHHY